MNRSQAWFILLLTAATVLAGIGHAFVAFQREIYPIDGYFYYVMAGLVFVWARRAARDLPETDLVAKRESARQAVSGLRGRLAELSSAELGPSSISGLLILNLISALLALLFSSAIAFVGWGASVVWLAAVLRPAVSLERRGSEVPPEASSQVVESDEIVDRGPLRLSMVLIGVSIAVLGQIVIAQKGVPGEESVGLLASIADALHLQIFGDPEPVLLGWFSLVAGAAVFGLATRRVALRDRSRLAFEIRTRGSAGLSGRWLAIAVVGIGLWLIALQSAVGESAGLGALLLWIAALALIGAAWRRIDVDRGVRLGLAVERREAYALVAVMIVALAVWLIRIDGLPASIWGDEGAYWTFTRDIASGLVQPNPFGLGTYSFPALGSIYQSIWASLLGPSIASWRIASVLAALASMLPLYFLARSLLGKRVAFVALAFFAASPYVLAYGRTGYLYAQAIFPVVAGAAFTVAAIRRDSRLFAFLAGAISGGGFLLYPSARFAIVLCALIALAFVRMTRGSTLARLGLAYASAVILTASPAVLYGLIREPDAYVDKLVENSMANVSFAESVVGRDELLARASFSSTRDHQLFFEPSLYVELAVRGWLMTAIGLNRGGLANEHYVVGPLAAPGALLFVLGTAWCLARGRRPAFAVWPIWLFAGTFLLSAIETYPPHASDLLPVAPVLAVLASLGLVGAVETAGRLWRAISVRAERALIVAVAGLVCASGLLMYFAEMPLKYRPNLEMAMFWSALELPRGSTLMFVRDEAYPPEFQPWGMQNFDTGVAWSPVEPGQLEQVDLAAACAVDCRVFYTPPYAASAEARLREVFGSGRVAPYTNELGDAIGYAFSPVDRP